ncbi:MAG TPA: type II toxin-antitoxin system RelE/ParE family toxin [Candidatus Paceibacterota bacterium]|nr:type II toxin-antitoxin system RelE/ParE family toxin [Candidatus Paceibacterota bacterium]
MDRITKLLKKLTPKERERFEETLALLLSADASSLDIKKLKGVEDIYRVRVGNLRVIFQKQGKEILILEVSRRDESTYKNY